MSATPERLKDPTGRFFDLCTQVESVQHNIRFSEDDFDALVAEIKQLMSDYPAEINDELRVLAEDVIQKSQTSRNRLFDAKRKDEERRKREDAEWAEQRGDRSVQHEVAVNDSQEASPNGVDSFGGEETDSTKESDVAADTTSAEPTISQQVQESGPSLVRHDNIESRARKMDEAEREKRAKEAADLITNFDFTQNYYQVLGVTPDATKDQIKAAHRKLIRLVHTDVLTELGITDQAKVTKAEQISRAVNEAYAVLSSDESRRTYDQTLSVTEKVPDSAEALVQALEKTSNLKEIIQIIIRLKELNHVFTYEDIGYSGFSFGEKQMTAAELADKIAEVGDALTEETRPGTRSTLSGLPFPLKWKLEQIPPIARLDRKIAIAVTAAYVAWKSRLPKRGYF